MADLLCRPLYGANMPDDFIEGISVQFHITAVCDQQCQHCYMYNSNSFQKQIESPLTKESIFILIDQINAFAEKYHICVLLAITGGDPILSPSFWDLLSYVKANYALRIGMIVMGNSYHIYQSEAERMKRLGVSNYQISIDGLEAAHDRIRKPGSFQDTLRAFRVLHQAGIQTSAAFTVSKMNANELDDVISFVDKCDDIDQFGFDKLTPMGNASDKLDALLSPDEYRDLLYSIYKKEALGITRKWSGKKDNLWKLLLYELGLTNPVDPEEKRIRTGCVAGAFCLTVLADGVVYACRRMEVSVGKFPEQNFEDIYKLNDLSPQLMNMKSFKGCQGCVLLPYCRGCIATAYACTGEMFSKDPNCWWVKQNG